jgi:hypothetical protein
MADGDPVSRPVVGELLLDPFAFSSAVILLVNDHYGKAHFPGIITGKVSDIAGLVFFPLLLTTLMDASARLAKRNASLLSRRTLALSAAATGLMFTAVKISSLGSQTYRLVWGLLNWPLQALAFGHWVPIRPARLVQDPSDLVALPMLLVSYYIGCRALRQSQRGSTAT